VAWRYSFPSQAEKIMWRVCCMIMLGVPFWLAGVFVTINMFSKFFYPLRLQIRESVKVTRYFYILARVMMLVEMAISLRSLSPGVYSEVHWTTFLPHA
jgi:hypothetical protein